MKPGKLIFYIFYYENENLFTDDDGHVIYDLFTVITPQELFLFRHDNGFNVFPMKGHDDVICEIIPVPDEVCGLQETPEIDLGDDYERIERYHQAVLAGHYY